MPLIRDIPEPTVLFTIFWGSGRFVVTRTQRYNAAKADEPSVTLAECCV
jgi:hypothetical protein